MDFTAIFGMLFTFAIIACGLLCIGLALHHRGRMRDFAHQERMAMIEKRLDPGRAAALTHGAGCACLSCGAVALPPRSRSAGTTLIGLGFALMVLITFAGGDAGAGVGVGGAVAVLGLTFLINGLLGSRRPRRDPSDTPNAERAAASHPESSPPPSSGQTV